jgi:SAM-dependent methyltransferase
MSAAPVAAAAPLDREAEAALRAPYRRGFGCSPREPLQRALDALYDYARDPETQVLHRSRLNRFDAVVRGLDARGLLARRGRALDLGCNAGYYTKLIADLGYAHVRGVDLEPEFVARARAHFASDAPGRTVTFEVADAEQLDERDAYDFVLCTEVIEHTRHPERVVAGLARALAPGGIALVTLPNRDSLGYGWPRLDHALKRRPHDPVLHDHLQWPAARARTLFAPHGLERLATAGANVLLVGPAIRGLRRAPGFAALHRLDHALSGGPLHAIAQFYFVVWRKPLRGVGGSSAIA